ncbi:MAG: hypothetical protein J4G04_08390 [Nitrosopumilaceae archaeon]|nr:hypothetical protein [Nitrosopumilaceae archaeon]
MQIMDTTPPTPNYLDAVIDITGYKNVSHGGNDFVQFTIFITNHEFTTSTNNNRDSMARSGEISVLLNAQRKTYPHIYTTPACDTAQGHHVWSNGEYMTYNDMILGQAESRSVSVSEDNCIARDRWRIRRVEARDKVLPLGGQGIRAGGHPVLWHERGRAQTISFLDYGLCHLPYMQYNEAVLMPLPEGHTSTTPPLEPPLMHAIYDTTTARPLLVFAESVIMFEADNISLIHDMATYNENGTAATLGGMDMHTVNGQSCSHILTFSIDSNTHINMLEAIESGNDKRLAISAEAIYTAERLTNIITHYGKSIGFLEIRMVR